MQLSPQVLPAEQRALLEERLRATRGGPAAVPRRADPSAPAPLSFAQERFWFLEQLEPAGAAYHVARAFSVEGPLSVQRLASALGGLISRHEVLRTGFELTGDGPRQRVRPVGRVVVPVVELAALPAELASRRLVSLARAEARRPFRLEAEPALRLRVVRLGEEGGTPRAALLWTAHHIASDGSSFPILYRELSTLYSDPGVALEPLVVQYADFAEWQRQRLTGEALVRLTRWWSEELEGAPRVLDLPADRPRPKVASLVGSSVRRALSPEVSRRLLSTAAATGSTPFVLALTAFAAVLSRQIGGHDLVVGTAAADRGRRELEGLAGMFVNTLALRLDLAGRPSFKAALARVRQASTHALAHLELPFEKLVEELGVERDLSRSPLVQVMWVWQREEVENLRLAGLHLEPLALVREESQFDLTVAVIEGPRGLLLHAQYAVELFDATRMSRLLSQLAAALAAGLEQPHLPLSQLPLLAAAERQQLLVEWGEGERVEHSSASVGAALARQIADRPDALALVDHDAALSFGELGRRAAGWARFFGELGVGLESVVALEGSRSLDLWVAAAGVLAAGAAYLPLDPGLPEERLRFELEDSGAKVLLRTGTSPALEAAAANSPGLATLSISGPSRDTLSHEASVAALAPASSAPLTALAYVIYTSGSTGRPKAVGVTHQGLSAFAAWFAGRFGLGAGERTTQLANPAFDASVLELWPSWVAGATVHLVPEAVRLSPGMLLDWLIERSITGTFLPTPIAEALMAELEGTPPPGLVALRYVATGGDRLRSQPPPGLGFTLHNCYGPTEITVACTVGRIDPRLPEAKSEPMPPIGGVYSAAPMPPIGGVHSAAPMPPIGRVVPTARLAVLEAGGSVGVMRAAALGVAGELVVGGVGVARGYLGRPALTAERFVPDPSGEPGARRYRTGDRVRFLPEGELEFLGRLDAQVKLRGLRIELGEIEALLAAHPAVTQAAVRLLPAPPHGEAPEGQATEGEARLVAYVASECGAALVSELAADLGRRLPAYMVPGAIVVLERLPLTARGKLDLEALPAPEWRSEALFEAPRGALEEALALLWSELLGVAAVGRQDNFFNLGGHSLLAVQLVSRLRQRLGVELELKAVFESPRLADLAAALARRLHHRGERPPLLPSSGEPVASFAQQRLWFLDQLQPGDPAYNLPRLYRFRGRLEVAALAGAFRHLLTRHEGLRTAFSPTGQPVVGPVPAKGWRGAAVPVVDLGRLAEPEAFARHLAKAEAHQPFVLSRPPLARLRLLTWGDDQGLMLWNEHHIASDGWSVGVLCRELAQCYEAALVGREAGLPELPLTLADFARWQRSWLDAATLEALVAPWRERLAGAPGRLDLPLDRPRTALASGRGGRHGWWLPPERLQALHASGRRQGATLFVVLLTAFDAFLSRVTGQLDLVVGTPLAGRSQAALEGLVGFFVNTLPMRLRLDGDPSLSELVARAQRSLLDTLAAEDLPFEKLVEALSPERDSSRPPIFETLFSLDPASGVDLRLPGLEIERWPAASDTAKLDLSLVASPRGEGLWLSLEYRADLFDSTTIRRWARWLDRAFEALAGPGSMRLSELVPLAPEERHQLLIEWSDATEAQPEPATLPARFGAQVAAWPEAIALATAGPLGGSELWSYGALSSRARRRALALVAAGVGPEHRVGIEARRSVDTVEAILAVVLAGGAYVPIDPDYPEERRRFLASDSGLERLLGPETPMPLSDPAPAALPTVLPDNLCYLIYTSGSTGRPKGVAVTHRNVVRLIFGGGYARLDHGARVLAAGSVSFDASTFELWGPLLWGGRLEIFPAGAPELAVLSSFILARRVTTVLLTTGLFNSLVEEQPEGLAEVSQVMTGGDSMSARHARLLTVAPHAVPGRRLLNVYGPTECTTFATTHHLPTGVEPRLPPPIGRAIGNTRLVVAGRGGEELPRGVPGELLIGGLGLARGYWNRPALTAERFVPAGSGSEAGARLYRSGDRVRFLATGELELLGRLDGQVKIRGFRVELGEIEATLAALAGLREARVVARQTGGDRRLVAYLVASAGEIDIESLRVALGERLPAFLIPAAFVVLPELPLTAHGKLDHRALPEPRWGDEQVFMPPQGALEVELAALFRDLLEVPAVGRHDDFFALGGHSLLATRLVSRLRRELGVELPLRVIFARPRLSELAAEVERATRSSDELPLSALEHHQPPPLSFAQLRLWLLDRFDPGASAANIPFQVEVKGVLLPRVWARAWAQLEQRQQGLRTTFPLVGDEPVQQVAPFAPRPIEVVDLSGLRAEEAHAQAERLADRSRRHRFDLARGPLWVRHLVRLGPEEHRLLANLHHIVGDGWSVGLILAEVAAGYTAALSGGTPKLPALPVSYADFAVWQRRSLGGDHLAAQLTYWGETLAGAPGLLELPTDRPRPQSASFRGAQLRLDLPAALATSLEGFCRQRGVTLFMVHLAAFATVLARWSGQDEVMVGTPVAGRTRNEVEGLVGCFLNTLVLRVPIDRGMSFEALVAKARGQALSAYAHAEVPFERLIEELQVERDLSRTPLFQAFLNVLNLPRREWGVPGLELEVRGHTEVEAKFDLTLYVREQGHGLGWNLVYNADLFNAERISELARQLEVFLVEALAEPARAVGSISLLTRAARPLLPDQAAPLSRRFFGTVPAILARQAELNPERLAVVDGLGELSYAELVEAMFRVAQALLESGLGRGERVGVWAHRGAALPAAVLGVLEAGGVYFILDPSYPATRLASFISIARPRALLRLEAAGPLPAEVEMALEQAGCRVMLHLPAMASSLADEPSWSRFPAKPAGVVLAADDPATLGFTSGSTGVPKAVVGRHGSLTHFKPWRARRFGLGPSDRFTLLSGLAHDPLQRDLFTPLQFGASIHVPEPARIGEPGYLVRWMREQNITVTHLTPAMAQLVTTAGSPADPAKVPSLRYAVLVGDVLTGRDVARLHDLAPEVTVINHYGATETQRAVSYHLAARRQDGEPAAEVLPLGRGIDGMQLLVLRPDGGLCGVGELGELVFRSPHLALGYLDDPELTARRFLTNPAGGESWDRLYRTGDLGRYQPDGEVVFAGRVDTQVKIRGFRVEPGEIQALLAQNARLAEVAVVAVDRQDAGGAQKLLAAYVVAKPDTGGELSAEDVRALVAARLPDYMVPSAVVFLDRLPMTPNGKLDRRALPAVEWGAHESAAPPATELEIWIAGLWRELLVVPAVGREDNFFRLGGHSLLATRLVARLASEIGLAVPLRTLFEAPRLADFAQRLEASLLAAE